jgi:hypothetical protein
MNFVLAISDLASCDQEMLKVADLHSAAGRGRIRAEGEDKPATRKASLHAHASKQTSR